MKFLPYCATIICLGFASFSVANECRESKTSNFIAKCNVVLDSAVGAFWTKKSPQVRPTSVSVCLYRTPMMDGLNNRKAVWLAQGLVENDELSVGGMWSRDSTMFGESRLFQELEEGSASAIRNDDERKLNFEYDYHTHQVSLYVKDYSANRPKYNFKLQCEPVVTRNLQD